MSATRQNTPSDGRGRIGARQRRRRAALVGAAAAAALAAVVIGTTGAYFTSSSGVAGQTGTVATLAAPTSFTAQKAAAADGTAGGSTTVNWSDAKSLPWAGSNPSATVKYTVERSTTGGFDDPASVTTLARETTALSASDTIGRQATGAWQAKQVEPTLLQQATFSLINGRVFMNGSLYKEATSTVLLQFTAVPREITGWAAEVKQISAGRDHVCGVLVTGVVQCWGFNGSGQLGNGTVVDSTATATTNSAPVTLVDDARNVFAGRPIIGVDAGMSFTCAWTADGTTGCWGLNDFGQLGNPSFTQASYWRPVAVVAAVNAAGTSLPKAPVRFLTAAEFHVCAVRGPITATDGTVTTPSNEETVVCWGRNNWKQLGANVVQNASAKNFTPKTVADTNRQFTGITAMASGEAVTCVVNDRTDMANIACWGGGGLGVLGDGIGQEVALPKAITSTARGFTAVALGVWHGCGVTPTEYTCWGGNQTGQLGNNTATGTTALYAPQGPYPISRYLGTAAGTITSVGVGWHHSCVTTTDGSMACWGLNDNKQLGQNASTTNLSIPTAVIMNIGTSAAPVYSPMRPRLIAPANDTGLRAGFINGAVYTWGSTTTKVEGYPSDLTDIASGQDHICAISAARGLLCSGQNDSGQLGTGNTSSASTPLAVNTAGGALQGKTIIDVSAGSFFSCALASDGTLACWGASPHGELGNGSTNTSLNPTAVANPNGMFAGEPRTPTTLVSGRSSSCVSSSTGVACWGWNVAGQLGNGTSGDSYVPAPVVGDMFSGGVKSLSSTFHVTCAIAVTSGRSYCWGRNIEGQTGVGGTGFVPAPSLVNTTTQFIGINAGGNASCGWTINEVTCWGFGFFGEAGSGGIGDRSPRPPRLVEDPQRVFVGGLDRVIGGGAATCAITKTQAVACWGHSAQNGNGSATNSATPQLLTGVEKPGGGAPTCLDGATLLADGRNCSLSPTLPYTYRLTYTVSGADNWRSTPAIASRPQ